MLREKRSRNSYQLSIRDFLRGVRFTLPSARPLQQTMTTEYADKEHFRWNIIWWI